MTDIVCVKKLRIGEGIPKICVPIVGDTWKKIFDEADKIAETSPDLAEWRCDFFQEIDCPERVREVLNGVEMRLKGIPLLFTFRSREEGGERTMEPDSYRRLNLMAAENKKVDLVDVECCKDPEMSKRLIRELHGLGVKVVGSSHNFQETPEKDEIIRRLMQMDAVGADIVKLAAMPKDEGDLLKILCATNEVKGKTKKPVVTMSMGQKGALSRICGAVFGSAITFGSMGQASAPGQIPVEELRGLLANIHQYCR